MDSEMLYFLIWSLCIKRLVHQEVIKAAVVTSSGHWGERKGGGVNHGGRALGKEARRRQVIACSVYLRAGTREKGEAAAESHNRLLVKARARLGVKLTQYVRRGGLRSHANNSNEANTDAAQLVPLSLCAPSG